MVAILQAREAEIAGLVARMGRIGELEFELSQTLERVTKLTAKGEYLTGVSVTVCQ